MKISTKKIKSNLPFIIICLIVLVIITILSTVANKENDKLTEVDLEEGTINVNKLVINEVMTSNKGTIADKDGGVYDYVEIYNGTDKDINLKNYGLSDSPTQIKWTFPDIVIHSKEYLIVFLCGKDKNGLYAPFSLKSSGNEQLGLFKPSGKSIDVVKTLAIEGGTVMARDLSGKWVVQNQPTPGYSNNKEGYESFIKSIDVKEGTDKTIVINEFLPNNKGIFKDSYGYYSGYIEIKNVSNKTINLENYSLSNQENQSFKWQFPSVSIVPNEILVIFTSNRDSLDGELHASFKLKNENGHVVLANNKGEVIDKVEYNNLANGQAYILDGDKFFASSAVTPGFANTADGIKAFQKKYMKTESNLIINEAMSSNYKYLPQNGGQYYDWLELYNNGKSTIKLSDYCLTTNTDTICKYKLPEVELKSGEYYIVMASGNTNLSNSSYKHANFNISDVQSLYLTKGDKVVDSLFVSNIPLGYSIGKGKSEGVYYYKTPTPKKENGSGTRSISYAPSASKETGTYDNVKSFKVALTCAGNTYYTTNGSNPTTSSKVYSSPLTIKKTTVLKVMCKQEGRLGSEVKTYSYIVNQKHKLPVLSLTINQSNFNSVNNNPYAEGYAKKAYIQLIEDGEVKFEIPGGLKLFGGSTRWQPKKSYEIKFKKQYGAAELEYQVFDDVDSSRYNSLVLRTGSQDELGTASRKTLIRDIVGTSMVKEYTKVDVQAYKPVIMYVNGKYWGIYFIREKTDETLVSNHYNVKTTKSGTDIIRIDGEVNSGSKTDYNKLLNYVRNNNVSNSSVYNKVKTMVDIESLCDYWIAEMYVANYDIVNSRMFHTEKVDDGKWHYVFYDLDFAMYNVNFNYYNFMLSGYGISPNGYDNTLIRNLMKNSSFRKTFIKRVVYNLKNTWNKNKVIDKIDDVIDELSITEIKRNLNRWNMSYSSWQNNITYLKNFARNRNKYIISHTKSYFNLSDSEWKKYYGG